MFASRTTQVSVGAWDQAAHKGFSLLATPNTGRGIQTNPYDNAELLLRLEAVDGAAAAPPMYFAVESCSNCTGRVRQLAEPGLFYEQLLAHTSFWTDFHSPAGCTTVAAPDRDGAGGPARPFELRLQDGSGSGETSNEGARLVDMSRSVISAGMSNFVGLRPNYGDGSNYW